MSEQSENVNADGTPKYTRHHKRDLSTNPEKISHNQNKKRKTVRYFYLDGKLHRVIHINRPADIVTTYSYADHDYRQYPWVWLKKNHKKAYGIQDVANMVQRHRRWIQRKMLAGDIRKPQKAYSLKNPSRFTYYFSEEDVLEIQDYFAHVHWGFKRKDGLITPGPTPSKSDLRVMMNDGSILYVKSQDGTFKPVWREVEDI